MREFVWTISGISAGHILIVLRASTLFYTLDYVYVEENNVVLVPYHSMTEHEQADTFYRINLSLICSDGRFNLLL